VAENPVSYDVDADKRFQQLMSRAIQSGLDLSFSMGEAARIIKKESGKNFILKGFGKYPPLNPAYQAWKQKNAPGTPILTGLKADGTVSGKLRKSIVDVTSDSILRIGRRSLEVGTRAKSREGAPYPGFVQEGTPNMPARKFLFFSNRMVTQIVNTVEADIANQLP